MLGKHPDPPLRQARMLARPSFSPVHSVYNTITSVFMLYLIASYDMLRAFLVFNEP